MTVRLYLHLLEVAHGLDGQLASAGARGVAWLQLDDGLGSLVQAGHLRLELVQLLSFLLWSNSLSQLKDTYFHLILFLHRNQSLMG